MRHDELHAVHDVRRGSQQHFPFGKRFGNQSELVCFEIAQAAVYQLRGFRRRARREIRLLDQRNLETASRGIARNAGAIDAATHDEKIDAVAGRHANLLRI
jgi:hypothetical protein